MTSYFIGDLRSGPIAVRNLAPTSGPWSDRLGAPQSVDVTLNMNSPEIRTLDLRNVATEAKAYLGVEEGGVIMACDPIWTRNYDRDAGTLKLGALGWGSYYNHRLILPLLAKVIGLNQWTVPDPENPAKTIPNPLLATVINGVSLGTRAKRLLQQAHLWTGGALPMVFQADEADDRTKTYDGTDFKSVGEAIKQISEMENGPEMRFESRFTADRRGVEVLFRTGTVAQPLLTSQSVPMWDVTAPQSAVSNFKTDSDASDMGSLAWQTGGRQADTVLVARAYDPALVDAGYPLMERFDSSHSSVEIQGTLDSYAADNMASGRYPTEEWSFIAQARPVDADGFPAGPFVGQYSTGDYADLKFAKFDPETNAGDPYLQAGGTSRHRIVGLSGDEKGASINVQLAPKVGI
ncbi:MULTISPECIES: hypothetical protein [Cryobacterium]|uniref:Uncharacterized protein n=1 Tax=Cryobacterium breve TaxID=1259258 RepID=A0ABY2J4G4_9MICO|nr:MULTISPECIES: hypothetical protein [Cryobacterium]TFC92034.1 hypothetical protein E3T20_12015 [Cryobacterium sp. TmT3-12]TFC99827.1 hypothetical protein E3O65_05490 [Cryobacterium breve]